MYGLVQQDAHQAAIAALQREIKLLRAENAFLRDQVCLINVNHTLYVFKPDIHGSGGMSAVWSLSV